ncbi:hypothetical protein [Streptomyces nojiriensis]
MIILRAQSEARDPAKGFLLAPVATVVACGAPESDTCGGHRRTGG